MLAFLGFSSQAAVQGLGPIECLQKHLEDPGHNNSERAGHALPACLPACLPAWTGAFLRAASNVGWGVGRSPVLGVGEGRAG